MGRTETSKGLAPPAIRKDMRAKQARHIINKVIPALLASNGRARRGAESSELIVDPRPAVACSKSSNSDARGVGRGANGVREVEEDTTYVKRKGQGRRKVKAGYVGEEEDVGKRRGGKRSGKMGRMEEEMAALRLDPSPPSSSSSPPPSLPPPSISRKVQIRTVDTLSAAHDLTFAPAPAPTTPKPSRKHSPNVFILNMASPLRPGGGVLTGATSQEEFLCARTTLLPSLQESFYRLPEVGGIYTKDVLVFRTPLPLGDGKGELAVAERYYVDVVSAGMLRFPELEGVEGEKRGAGAAGEEEEEEEETETEEEVVKCLSKRDREMVERKMRAVLRIAVAKGAKKVVLGAWGCGAYGNPVVDIAHAWRKVLDGAAKVPASSAAATKRGKAGGSSGEIIVAETWPEIEHVVFAIANRKMAEQFAQAYGGDVEVEEAAGRDGHDGDDDDDDEEDKVGEELRAKIGEMEEQLRMVRNPDLKERMGVILSGLRVQLRMREGGSGTGGDEGGDGGDGDEGKDGERSEEDSMGNEDGDDDEEGGTDEYDDDSEADV